MIYFIKSGAFVKIGVANNVKTRISELSVGNPDKVELLASVEGGLAEERALHEKFAAYWHRGEWFFMGGELLDYISKLKPKPLPAPEPREAAVTARISAIEIAERLLRIRRVTGYTQVVFAKKLGMRQSTYSSYEAGLRKCSMEMACRIAREFGASLDYIFLGDERSLTIGQAEALRAIRHHPKAKVEKMRLDAFRR